MLSACDIAGVIDMDWELASFSIGETVSNADLPAMKDNVFVLPSGKLFLPGFIPFQNKELNSASKAHQAVLKLLEFHGIPYPYSMDTLSKISHRVHGTHKDKVKDKVKVKVGVNEPFMDQWNTLALKSGLPKIEGISDSRRKHIEARMSENPDFWEVLERELPVLQDFAKGGNPDRVWYLTFDFCLSQNNFLKIKEGKYRKEEPKPKEKKMVWNGCITEERYV